MDGIISEPLSGFVILDGIPKPPFGQRWFKKKWETLEGNRTAEDYSSLKLTLAPIKNGGRKLLSYWETIFSSAMWVFGSVDQVISRGWTDKSMSYSALMNRGEGMSNVQPNCFGNLKGYLKKRPSRTIKHPSRHEIHTKNMSLVFNKSIFRIHDVQWCPCV